MLESHSPKVVLPVKMNFPDAIREVIAGARITKLEWKNNNIYGILDGTRLRLHKDDGKMYDWIISDGDITGEDWIVISKVN